MSTNHFLTFALTLFINLVVSNTISFAQDNDSGSSKKSTTKKEIEKNIAFAKTDSLINSRQFVFQAEFNQGSDMIFVVVDSSYGEVQAGNRNNLEGRITDYKVTKNEKSKSFSITIKMRGQMYTADVFLYIGTYGNGRATVKSEFPGYFAFDGNLFDFENCTIYEGKSHFVH